MRSTRIHLPTSAITATPTYLASSNDTRRVLCATRTADPSLSNIPGTRYTAMSMLTRVSCTCDTCSCFVRDLQQYLSIDDSRLGHRQAQGREGVPDGVVDAILVHNEADSSAGRGDTEEVRRGHHPYSRGSGRRVATTNRTAVTGRSASLLLLQLIDMVDKSVLQGRAWRGDGESTITPRQE